MKASLLRWLFFGFVGLTCSISTAQDRQDTVHPVEQASRKDLDKTSVGGFRAARPKISALETPTLRADIEPPRSFTLVQRRLANDPFTIEKRWVWEFEQTPMRSTGYWVEAGDTLTINFRYTGSAPSPMPSVWIHSLDDNSRRYDTDQKVRLHAGNNVIVAAKKGAVYVAVENAPTGGAMNVAIVSGGHPMPRFVLGQHAAADWSRMLQTYANAPYAEFVSERAMITASLAHARMYVDDPVGMLETWDRIINFAEAQYGLSLGATAPNDSPQLPYHFVECMRCNGYMYAWTYRTAYVDDQIGKVISRQFLEHDGWGPWHELGHVLQHDDLTADYDHDGEATNNLTSLWVQTHLFGQKSELEVDKVWQKKNGIVDYVNQSSKNWDQQRDVWVRLGMYWQLALAFGPTFYPRYAIASRSLKGYPGGAKQEKQARVVIETSRVSGYNLLPFYDKWGMPITAATRAQVNGMGLKTLDKPIWKNTDMSAPYTYYGPDDELPPIGDIVVADQVHGGDRFSAVADASSPGGHALSYQWDHGSFENPVGATTNTLTVIAPKVQSPTPMAMSVTVNDGKHSSTFNATVLVQPEAVSPTVNLTAQGGPFVAPANVTLNATVAAPGSQVNTVAFYHGDQELGEDRTAPYSYQWNAIAAGTYQVTAKVTATPGGTATSSPVTVTVQAAGGGDSCDSVAPWSSTKVYATVNEKVSYDGYIYESAHWTQGARPDRNWVETGSAKGWRRLAPCSGGGGPGPEPGGPPTGTLDGENTVGSKLPITLTANARSQGGHTLSYSWTQPAGFTGAAGNTRVVTWTAPQVTSDTPVTIKVDVSDQNGTQALSKTVTIKAPTSDNHCAPAWVATKAYATVNEKVSYDGYNYESAHWTQGARPDQNWVESGSAKGWRRLGTCTP